MPLYHRFLLDEGSRTLAVELPLSHFGEDPKGLEIRVRLLQIRAQEHFTGATDFTYLGRVERNE